MSANHSGDKNGKQESLYVWTYQTILEKKKTTKKTPNNQVSKELQ